MLLGRAIREQQETSSLVNARVKFLSAAEAEDATPEQKQIAKQSAEDCRSGLNSEEKIEKAREVKRQSRKNQPLLRRHSAVGLSSLRGGEEVYTTPVKSMAPVDFHSPNSGSAIIIPPSPREYPNIRQTKLSENASLKKDFAQLYI